MNPLLRVAIITTDARHWLGGANEIHPNFGTAIRSLLQGFALLEEIEVHVISASPSHLQSPAKLASNIWFHHLYVPKMGWGRTLFLGCSRACRKLLKDIRPDIVHGQGTERDCAITAVKSGFPNVLTIHGNVKELYRLGMFGTKLYGPMATFLENVSLRRTLGVFCNSEYTRSLVAPRANLTWLVPNAIRAEFFQASTVLHKREIPTFVIVGLIAPRKRQLELLRMIGEITKSGRRIQVVFAGSNSDNTAYGASFAEELDKATLAGFAEFAGFLDAPGLIRLLDSSHAFLHFPQEEAFGLVVAEAMARGLKFFGARLGGIVDIASGINGAELHDDFESLQAGVIRWLDEGAQLPAHTADEIARRYHPHVIAKEHLRIYRKVLGSRQGDRL